jgi:capsular exopolysaccharide synthesis family protein
VEPLDYLRSVAQRWTLILGTTVAALLVAWVTMPDAPSAPSAPQAVTYEATATLLDTGAEVQGAGIVAFLAQSTEVARRVAEQLGEDPAAAGQIAAAVSVTDDPESPLLTVRAVSPDGTRAEALADAYATILVSYLVEREQARRDRQIAALEQQYEESQAEAAELAGQASDAPGDELLQLRATAAKQVVESVFGQILTLRQQPPPQPAFEILERPIAVPVESATAVLAASDGGTRLLMAGVGGLAVGCVLALALARLDTRPRSRAEVQDTFGLPVLAEVPRVPLRHRSSSEIQVVEHPEGAIADGYRTLRSAMTLLEPSPIGAAAPETSRSRTDDGSRVFLITSAREGEGKTSTIVNLAAAYAEIGKRVLVIDCDLRNPSCHRFLDVPLGSGITDLVGSGLENLARQTKVRNVRLVQAGSDETGHALLAVQLPVHLEAARAMADVVLLDSPPVLSGNEAIDVMAAVDAVLVVARSGRATADQVHRARDIITRMHVPVFGVALVGGPGRGLPLPLPWPARKTSRSAGSRRTAAHRRPADVPDDSSSISQSESR